MAGWMKCPSGWTDGQLQGKLPEPPVKTESPRPAPFSCPTRPCWPTRKSSFRIHYHRPAYNTELARTQNPLLKPCHRHTNKLNELIYSNSGYPWPSDIVKSPGFFKPKERHTQRRKATIFIFILFIFCDENPLKSPPWKHTWWSEHFGKFSKKKN
jgi:hypothetical protein